jgi:hypothetical protein
MLRTEWTATIEYVTTVNDCPPVVTVCRRVLRLLKEIELEVDQRTV